MCKHLLQSFCEVFCEPERRGGTLKWKRMSRVQLGAKPCSHRHDDGAHQSLRDVWVCKNGSRWKGSVTSRPATKHSCCIACERRGGVDSGGGKADDHPPRRYPTLTRLGLVQRWAVLEIPLGSTSDCGERFKDPVPSTRSVEVLPRRGWGYKPNVDELQRVYVGYGCWRFYSEGVVAV
jgi:hypothetical protein